MICPWSESRTVGTDSFCEAIRECAWVQQPANASSALAFVVTAGLLAGLAWNGTHHILYVLALSALVGWGPLTNAHRSTSSTLVPS